MKPRAHAGVSVNDDLPPPAFLVKVLGLLVAMTGRRNNAMASEAQRVITCFLGACVSLDP